MNTVITPTFDHWDAMSIRLGGAVAFIVSVCICWSMFETFNVSPPLVQVGEAQAVVSVNGGIRTYEETRTFDGRYPIEVISTRVLVSKETGSRIPLETGSLQVKKGSMPILRSFILPGSIRGTWCSNVTIHWKTTFSLRTHSENLPEVCFGVRDKNE